MLVALSAACLIGWGGLTRLIFCRRPLGRLAVVRSRKSSQAAVSLSSTSPAKVPHKPVTTDQLRGSQPLIATVDVTPCKPPPKLRNVPPVASPVLKAALVDWAPGCFPAVDPSVLDRLDPITTSLVLERAVLDGGSTRSECSSSSPGDSARRSGTSLSDLSESPPSRETRARLARVRAEREARLAGSIRDSRSNQPSHGSHASQDMSQDGSCSRHAASHAKVPDGTMRRPSAEHTAAFRWMATQESLLACEAAGAFDEPSSDDPMLSRLTRRASNRFPASPTASCTSTSTSTTPKTTPKVTPESTPIQQRNRRRSVPDAVDGADDQSDEGVSV